MSVGSIRKAFGRGRLWVCLAGLAVLLAATPVVPALSAESVLYSFKGGRDGALPYSGLTLGESGTLYGTTFAGGANHGVVFQLTPPVPPATKWTETVLYRFKGGEDGSQPIARLVRDQSGALYGTTTKDGGGGCFFGAGCGTVFKLTPPVAPDTKWTKSTLHRFDDANEGGGPHGALVLDKKGALYGTTYDYGCCLGGTVFKLMPPKRSADGWTKTVLYRFQGGDDGTWPYAGLVMDKSGALYGTTVDGGDGNYGRIFRLTPPTAPSTSWTKFEIYRFKFGRDGARPYGGLIIDRNGALYGTTDGGGGSDSGTVFKVTPPQSPSVTWTTTTIHRFRRDKEGIQPHAGLAMDRNGALFGTTAGGGSSWGTVFKLSPPNQAASTWTHTVLHRFKGQPDGGLPYGGLVIGGGGTLYGTTSVGGVNRGCGQGCGTVFKID